ncbi:hypothetical protein CVT26_013277 [Gymnopilus dilepis]|uniref:Uncharacterized protein n=1 Tax=Gymnopilus dilepis TaxID=231916 RepID=A0A409VUR2_9AGAR|nr:hypothetical protein CVT26_013277 [Gymnopilus dilepis]
MPRTPPGDDSASESSSDATSNRYRRKKRVIWRYRWRTAPKLLRRQESNNCPPSMQQIAVTRPEVLVAAANTSASRVGPALGHSGELRNLQQIVGTFGSPQTASFDLPSASELPPAYENRDTP